MKLIWCLDVDGGISFHTKPPACCIYGFDWLVAARETCCQATQCGLSICMQTHKRTLFIGVFMKAGQPRRAEQETKRDATASCTAKVTRRPSEPEWGASRCCKPHSHLSAALPHQLADCVSALAKSPTSLHEVTEASGPLCWAFSVLSAWPEERKTWQLLFSHCHVGMKSSSWNTGFFSSFCEIPHGILSDQPAAPAWLQRRPKNPSEKILKLNRTFASPPPLLSAMCYNSEHTVAVDLTTNSWPAGWSEQLKAIRTCVCVCVDACTC